MVTRVTDFMHKASVVSIRSVQIKKCIEQAFVVTNKFQIILSVIFQILFCQYR